MDHFINTDTSDNFGYGSTHRVVIVTGISTKNQDIRACGDSAAYCRNWAEQNLPGKCKFQVISSQASGECLDCPELRRLEDMVLNKEVTIVLLSPSLITLTHLKKIGD